MGSAKKLYRLPEVLSLLGIKKSKWWQGIREGHFPQGHLLGPRVRVWTDAEIAELIDSIASDSLGWKSEAESVE